MPGRPLQRMADELGVDVADIPEDAKPRSLAERTGLNADRRSLGESLADKRGRPSTLTPMLAEAIITRMAEGATLTEICLELEDAPHPITVSRWMESNVDFARAIQTAKRQQAATLADLAYVRARDAHPYEVGAAANYLKAVQWLASKLDPHGYGEKSLPVGASLNIADMAEADLEGLMATLQAEKNARAQARNILPEVKKDDKTE